MILIKSKSDQHFLFSKSVEYRIHIKMYIRTCVIEKQKKFIINLQVEVLLNTYETFLSEMHEKIRFLNIRWFLLLKSIR